MKKILIFFVITVALSFIASCLSPKKLNNSTITYNFINNKKIDTIKLTDNNVLKLTTFVYLCNDTIMFIIDTGASCCTLDTLTNDKTNCFKENSYTKITDIAGITKKVKSATIKKMQLGNIEFNNVIASFIDYNILGNDILKNFCVKFDWQQKLMILSKNSDLIEKKGLQIPFHLDNNNLITFPILLSGNNQDTTFFILDSGYPGEILLTDSTYRSLNLQNDKVVKWISEIRTLNAPKNHFSEDSTFYYSYMDIKLGDKPFKNALVQNMNTNLQTNIIGYVFMKRFKTVTIDYTNKILYLELPDDFYNDEFDMKFSEDTITEVPISYCSILYSKINSLGIQLSQTSTKTLAEFAHRYKNKIKIGDTLVGINNMIFDKNVFNKLHKKNTALKLIADSTKQNSITQRTLYHQNQATFYFKRNKQLFKIETVRDRKLKSPPQRGYDFVRPKGIMYCFSYTTTVTKPKKAGEKKPTVFAIHKVHEELYAPAIEK